MNLTFSSVQSFNFTVIVSPSVTFVTFAFSMDAELIVTVLLLLNQPTLFPKDSLTNRNGTNVEPLRISPGVFKVKVLPFTVAFMYTP
ncbi:hypothetical protein TCA2_4338 [Paenibacillus sp. TCA20]|nr:hypothetical protein TCA2_4338 [Paenibacillus sp. TCA20]